MSLPSEQATPTEERPQTTVANAAPASRRVNEEGATLQLLGRFVVFQWLTLGGGVALLGFTLIDALVHARFAALQRSGTRLTITDDQLAAGVHALCTLLGGVGGILSFVSFFIAMARARRIAVAAGITGLKYGYPWTVGALFLPIVSFYRPWLGLAEIRRSILGSVRMGDVGTAWTTTRRFSFATLALAIVQIASGLFSMLKYGSEASTLGSVARTRDSLIASATIDFVAYGALFLYLITLSPKLRQVIPLAYREVFD